jgi:hypothetical protein
MWYQGFPNMTTGHDGLPYSNRTNVVVQVFEQQTDRSSAAPLCAYDGEKQVNSEYRRTLLAPCTAEGEVL